MTPAYPASDTPEDIAAATRFDGSFNRWFLDPLFRGSYPEDLWESYGTAVPKVEIDDFKIISAPLDFLGVNYYSRAVVAHHPDGWLGQRGVEVDAERTDMGWEVFPKGLSDLLERLARDYDVPKLYVTENGAAYPDTLDGGTVRDDARTRYLENHIHAVHTALTEGVDVRGYFAWSLMDNFEWAKGYSKRFGLVYVDYATQMRTLKESARWYQRFVAEQRATVSPRL